MSQTTLAAVDFESTVTDGIRTVATFVPKLIGFLVILLIGYFVAKIVAKILDKVLERVGFDAAVEKGPVKQALSKSKYDASDIVSKLVFYAIFIPVLSAAVGVLGIQALQEPLAAFIALIPKIIVAVIILVVGGVVSGAVKTLIQNALGGLSFGNILATGVGVLVVRKGTLWVNPFPGDDRIDERSTGFENVPAALAAAAALQAVVAERAETNARQHALVDRIRPSGRRGIAPA